MRRQNHLGRVWLELRTPLIAAGVVSVVCLAAPPAVGAQVEITAVNPETVAEFTAAFIKEFTRQNPDEAELTFGLAPEQRQAIVEFAVTAAEFRAAMAAAAPGQGGAAAQDDIDLFTRSLELGPDGPPPALWRSFFQGSVIAVGHALAPVKRAGFYNALVDGWIMADWAQDKEGLSLVGVRAVPGAVVRYQEVTGIQLPPWTRMTDESVVTALGAAHREAMRAINGRVNEQPYITDAENFGRDDYYASPLEFLVRSGDCEDFAIFKYFALTTLGFADASLRIVLVERVRNRTAHAVLAVYLGQEIYILDNETDGVLPHAAIRGYRPLFSFNAARGWSHHPTLRSASAKVRP